MNYIGLMSGTSVDAVDAALVQIGDEGEAILVATHVHPFPTELRSGIHALLAPGPDELFRAGQLDMALGRLYAEAVTALLEKTGLRTDQIRAIGSHGQTLRHHPDAPHPFTLQVGNPAVIAQYTGITTVADFRPRDMAAGGQGAPLAPAFHQAAFRAAGINRAVINIGGIGNVTFLPGDDAPAVGFDTGPGNTLLDTWIGRHRGQDQDTDGAWAATGRCHAPLLAHLCEDPYFQRPPPKSSGREYFNLDWLDRALQAFGDPLPTQDVQATLVCLTVDTITDALWQFVPAVDEVYVCGGGAHNPLVMARLQEKLAPVPVASTAGLGVDPDWVEAIAFAWLAHRTLHGQPGNLPAVTGARQAVVLGGIWHGGNAAQSELEPFEDGD